MSSVFSGYPVQTKPGNPRMDMSAPTDPDSEATQNFYLHLYRDINGAGGPQPTASYAIGDDVDLTKQQSLHSTMMYLLDFSRENGRILEPPTGTGRECYILSLPVGGIKRDVTVLGLPVNNTATEDDLVQGAVNLVIYLFGPDAPESLVTGAGHYYAMGKRLIEMAREKDYFTVGVPRRLDPTIDDQTDNVGGEVTFEPPTWSEVAPQAAPDILQWVANGELVPGSDGALPLLVENLTIEQNGDFYRVRAGYLKPGATVPDAWRHSQEGTLIVTDN